MNTRTRCSGALSGHFRVVAGLGLVALSCVAPLGPTHALQLDAAQPVEVVCDTKAVVVATDAARATTGAVRLSLGLGKPGDVAKADTSKEDAGPQPGGEPKPAAGAPAPGTWRIVSVAPEHKGAFAVTQAETCRDGCPLALQSSGEIQLWAPKPASIDRLGENDVLLLAIIKPATGVLRASTFRGQQIEALEEGACGLGVAGPAERP